VAPEELEGTKDGTSDKDAENSEDRPIQASSSSVRRAAGGIEDDMMITGVKSKTQTGTESTTTTARRRWNCEETSSSNPCDSTDP
jgi:hypothetical protein